MRVMFRNRPSAQQKLFVAREDFKYLTIESERTGALGHEERQMIHNVVDFRAVTARQVMLPMEKVRTIPAQASVEELLARSQAEDIERWPVVDGSGAVVALVNVFEIALDGRRRGIVESYQRRIIKVAPEEAAYDILKTLRAARTTAAAVIDGNGRPLGIVTWESLIERLVAPVATAG